MDKKIHVTAEVFISDLASMINDALDHDQTAEFVKTLDAEVADWDFTLSLAKWFLSQILMCKEEVQVREYLNELAGVLIDARG
jgi:hypothetical protein